MATKVNLDALIPREDFLATDGADIGASGKSEASRTDLAKGESFYVTLRKPDFQRETAAWTPEAIRDFIQAFIEGDLIPSVICWQSPTRLTFVIDGAHRLSAIMAWLSDDYGDGEESIRFYNNIIPDEQRKVAKETRDLVNQSVGSYKEHKAETQNPGSNPKLTANARALAHSKIPLLWVNSSDPKKAEKAFFTINQSAVQIDPTELKILNARFKPNAIASRAIVRNSTGHKYWKDFKLNAQAEMENLGREIYKALYSPPLNPPIRTLDLPIAGHGYGSQTLPLIFDFVNIANDIPVSEASRRKTSKSDVGAQSNIDEEQTVLTMRGAGRLVRRMTGTHPSSLGLHPAVYFYSANGKHQPTTVLAMASLVKDLSEIPDSFLRFTETRAEFERFLVEHKIFVNQLTVMHGSMAKGFRQLKEYYQFVISCLQRKMSFEEIGSRLKEHDKYQKLVKERPVLTKQPKEFSKNLKQLVYLSEALEKSFICAECGSRIDPKSMHLDHELEKSSGGVATSENARWLHPFCDSTYKSHKRSGN